MQQLSAWDTQHADGETASAARHDVSVNGLHRLMREDDGLTALERDKIKREVPALLTRRLMQQLSAWDTQHADGETALASPYDVLIRSFGQLIHADGRLTARGQSEINRVLNPEAYAVRAQPITGTLLQEVAALGEEGIQSAGGVAP
jgi:hypothetical protein